MAKLMSYRIGGESESENGGGISKTARKCNQREKMKR